MWLVTSKFAEVAATAGKVWDGAKGLGTQAWTGAKNLGNRALSGAKNLSNHALVAAKNWGNRALNAADHWGYEAQNWLGHKFPSVFGEPEFAGIGGGLERPTPRPMMQMPEKQQPLRMNANNPEGQGQVPGTSTTSGKTSQSHTPEASSTPTTKSTTAEEAERISPHKIRFSQDTVSPNFSNGGTLTDVVGQLRSGKLSADQFPTIRVVEHNGKLYSLDNRRLSAFKAAQLEDIPIQRLDLSDPAVRAEFLKKFKPINDGWNNVVVPAAGRAEARRILREYGKYDSN
jgi:hypothetical protein